MSDNDPQTDDIPIGARDLYGLVRQYQRGDLDEGTIRDLWDRLDEQQKREAFSSAFEEGVQPHLEDVRTRAINDPDPEAIREHYAGLTDTEQDEVFFDALGDVVVTCEEIRERPVEGLKSLKSLLRDPYTTEALLLIFESDEHIDPEYSEEMKAFAAEHIQLIGVSLMPEAYSDETLAQIRERFERVAPADD